MSYRCGVCLNKYDYGYMADKILCCFCRDKCDELKFEQHPITKKPFERCYCGKIWNSWCAISSMSISVKNSAIKTGDETFVPHYKIK